MGRRQNACRDSGSHRGGCTHPVLIEHRKEQLLIGQNSEVESLLHIRRGLVLGSMVSGKQQAASSKQHATRSKQPATANSKLQAAGGRQQTRGGRQQRVAAGKGPAVDSR